MTARGIRNRNPGNIEDGGFARRQPGYAGPEPAGRFATFETMGHGIAALVTLLEIYRAQHKLTTVRGIINRWAPPKENQTSAYVRAVCDALGAGPDVTLPDKPGTYMGIARAICAHENGRDVALITEQDYADGFRLALGVSVAPFESAPPPVTAFPVDVDTPVGSIRIVNNLRTDGTPPAPIEERVVTRNPEPTEDPMPAPIVAAAAPWLLQAALPKLIEMAGTAVPSLIRIFGTPGSPITERNAKAAEELAKLAQAATVEPTLEGAVAKLETDPQARAAYERDVLADLDRLLGMVERVMKLEEDSRDRAAARAAADSAVRATQAKLVDRGFRLYVGAVALTGGALGLAIWLLPKESQITSMLALLFAGAVQQAVQKYGQIVDYHFGSSAGSALKDLKDVGAPPAPRR